MNTIMGIRNNFLYCFRIIIKCQWIPNFYKNIFFLIQINMCRALHSAYNLPKILFANMTIFDIANFPRPPSQLIENIQASWTNVLINSVNPLSFLFFISRRYLLCKKILIIYFYQIPESQNIFGDRSISLKCTSQEFLKTKIVSLILHKFKRSRETFCQLNQSVVETCKITKGPWDVSQFSLYDV